MGTTLTYVFYAAGLFLALLPILIDFVLQKRNSNKTKKPKWYLLTVVIIGIFLLGVGGYKINLDNFEKISNDSLQKANKSTINKLSTNIDSIKVYLKTVKDSDNQFEEYLFNGFKIKRSRSDNRPIYIGKVDNSHKNYTHINKADKVDIH